MERRRESDSRHVHKWEVEKGANACRPVGIRRGILLRQFYKRGLDFTKSAPRYTSVMIDTHIHLFWVNNLVLNIYGN